MLTTAQQKEFAQLSQASYAYFTSADFFGNGGSEVNRPGF